MVSGMIKGKLSKVLGYYNMTARLCIYKLPVVVNKWNRDEQLPGKVIFNIHQKSQ